MRTRSIARRLAGAVVALELISAVLLIVAITVHERHIQFRAFDASLVVKAESLMGAVQDAEDPADNVLLDMRTVRIPEHAVFHVEDEKGRVLGQAGAAPQLEPGAEGEPEFHDVRIAGRMYRCLVLREVRIVDPGEPGGGTAHRITIVYGMPVGRVWHEVVEAVRFFAIATLVLLGVTALLMAWLVRRGLSPLNELAQEARRITSSDWRFEAPASAKETVELEPLTAALEAALARLELAFEQQRRFTSDAAHELKTDVAIVKSSLQLLAMRRRSEAEYSEGLAVSLEDFTRLEMTVEKMLTLARLERPVAADGAGIRKESCSLRGAVEDVLQQSGALAEMKGLEILFECDGDAVVPIGSGDAHLLSSNIVLNAVQHSPEGGRIDIGMTVDDVGVRLTVRDKGEGISDEDREHLFEPFYRGDPSRSRKSGGTGLGLSICKAICERAGGSIEIRNNDAGGALVTVVLPVEGVAPDAASSA